MGGARYGSGMPLDSGRKLKSRIRVKPGDSTGKILRDALAVKDLLKKQEKEEKEKDYYRKERSFGSFRHVLPIPVAVDEAKIQASFKKGVLSIELPKTKESQKKVKKITVKAAQ